MPIVGQCFLMEKVIFNVFQRSDLIFRHLEQTVTIEFWLFYMNDSSDYTLIF